MSVDYVRNGQVVSTGSYETGYAVKDGDYVAATVRNGQYTAVDALTKLSGVSRNAWTGTSSVLSGGRSYLVAGEVLCYNRSSGEYTSLEQALAYADTVDLYVRDGVVRVVEVNH